VTAWPALPATFRGPAPRRGRGAVGATPEVP
jgi:hypothetical protein